MSTISKAVLNNECEIIYEQLKSLQYQTGEFGKGCEEMVASENQHRHASIHKINIDNVRIVRKPNCSISLIAALGIKALHGINDSAVQKTYKWFSNSEYISNGWFQQDIYQLDSDPFGGISVPLKVQDVRHTATALLGVLRLGSTCTFGTTAFRNLTQESVMDSRVGGWVAVANVNAITNHYDFYTTIYMLASLNFIKNDNITPSSIYGMGNERLNQLINMGCEAICTQPPALLGYNNSLEQTLRANATLLFFCADLISERSRDFFDDSLEYLISNGKNKDGYFNWNNDLQTTINVLAGIISCLDYISSEQLSQLKPIIDQTLKYILSYEKIHYNHPASLGFLLCGYKRLMRELEEYSTLSAKKLYETLKGQIALLDKFKREKPFSKANCDAFIAKLQKLINSLTDANYDTLKQEFEKDIKPYIERDCGGDYVYSE